MSGARRRARRARARRGAARARRRQLRRTRDDRPSRRRRSRDRAPASRRVPGGPRLHPRPAGAPGGRELRALGAAARSMPIRCRRASPASALDSRALPPDSDGDGRAEGSPLLPLAPALDGVLGVAPGLAFATASGYEEVLFVNADQGSLRSFTVATPASLAAADYPLLPPPGSSAPRTAVSTLACVPFPPGALDSRGDPVAVLAALRRRPAAHDLHVGGRSLRRDTSSSTTSNLGEDPGTANTQFLPGSVLVYDVDLAERAAARRRRIAQVRVDLHERLQPDRRDAGRHARRPRLRAGDGERRDRRAQRRSADPGDRGRRRRAQRRGHRRDRSGRAPARRERPARARGPLLRSAGGGSRAARRVHGQRDGPAPLRASISPRSTRSPRWRPSTRRCGSTGATRARASATPASSMPRSPSRSTRSRTARRPRAATASWWRPPSTTRGRRLFATEFCDGTHGRDRRRPERLAADSGARRVASSCCACGAVTAPVGPVRARRAARARPARRAPGRARGRFRRSRSLLPGRRSGGKTMRAGKRAALMIGLAVGLGVARRAWLARTAARDARSHGPRASAAAAALRAPWTRSEARRRPAIGERRRPLPTATRIRRMHPAHGRSASRRARSARQRRARPRCSRRRRQLPRGPASPRIVLEPLAVRARRRHRFASPATTPARRASSTSGASPPAAPQRSDAPTSDAGARIHGSAAAAAGRRARARRDTARRASGRARALPQPLRLARAPASGAPAAAS